MPGLYGQAQPRLLAVLQVLKLLPHCSLQAQDRFIRLCLSLRPQDRKQDWALQQFGEQVQSEPCTSTISATSSPVGGDCTAKAIAGT